MHCSQTWLLLLATLSSYVSAFYPYQPKGSTLGGNDKRFYPIAQSTVPSSDTIAGTSVKLDLHKTPIQKRDNQFSVSLSNPSTGGLNSLAINQDGSDYSYFSTIKFGSKAQEMYMLIDTGSANTWVFSSDCKSSTCSIHNTFGKEDSTTLKTTTEAWSLAYGSGQVDGLVATDTLAFANFSVNTGFGLATNASDDFNNYPMDGILGLGRGSSDQLGTPTIMEVLTSNKAIASSIIGIHLNRAEDNTKDGEIVFGGVDTGKFSGQLSYIKTTNDDAWEIPVQDFLVNSQPVNFTSRTAIIDTGTTFILMPPADAQALHALIPGSTASGESFTLPCSTSVKLEVKINNKLYSISPKDYVGNPSSGSTITCASSIIGHQAYGAQQWILGDVFLKNVYTVFDSDNQQIGFGLLGTGGTVTSSSSSGTSTSSGSSSSSKTSVPSSSGTTSAKSSTSTSVSGASSSARATSTGSVDSNIGQASSSSAPSLEVLGYWKVGFSICAAMWLGAGAGAV